MAHDPNRREIRYHSNAQVYFSVFHGKRTRFVAVAGSSVANQVQAAIQEGAVDLTQIASPANIHFLEGLPEDPA